MRKAEKRRIGIAKQEKNLQDSIRTGLEAQNGDRERREEALRQALISRDKKPKYVDGGPKSKISQEKQARVAKRLAEKNKEYAPSDLERMHAEEMIDLERRDAIYGADADDERTNAEMVEYAKADVDLTINLLDVLFPPKQTCEKYGCTFSTTEEHEKICPGNVSFRTQFVEHN